MLFLTIIASILPLMVQCQHHEISLIKQLNRFFHFDHNIFLLNPATHSYFELLCKDDNSGNFTPQTVFDLDNHGGFSPTQMDGLMSSVSGNTFLIGLFRMQLRDVGPLKALMARVQAVRSIHVNVKFAIFFTSDVTEMPIIHTFLMSSWTVGIANVFCAFYTSTDNKPSFNVFRYDPFGSPSVINVTGSESLQNYFFNKIPNYQQRPIRIAQISTEEVGFFHHKFWNGIRKALNASFRTIPLTIRDGKAVYATKDMTDHDFIIHQAHHDTNDQRMSQIYPHRILAISLLVPHAKPRSGVWEYIQNATWKLIFMFSFIALVAASLLLTISEYLKTKRIRLVKSVTDVVNLIVNDNGAISYGQLNRADLFVVLPLTFTGLIVMNGVLSVFQSYLTLPLYERQINSVEDLFQSAVPIIDDDSIFWTNRTNQLLEDASRHGGWKDRFIRTNFQKVADKFNDSVALFLINYQADVYLEAQKQLNLKAYHLVTGVSFHTFFSMYPASAKYPFIDGINDIVHRMQCAGMIEKWFKDVNNEAVARLKTINKKLKTTGNDLETGYSNELTVLWIGWTGSTIVFVCELIWNRLQSRVDKCFTAMYIKRR